MTLLQIPPDTWFEIAELLQTQDLVNLRLVSKHFHDIFSSSRIWKPLTQVRWFSIDDQPREFLNGITDFYSYYTQRAHLDQHITTSIGKIVESSNPLEIFEIGWNLTRLNYKAIPLLNKLRTSGENLTIKYYAHMILTSIRHGEVVQMLHEISSKYLDQVEDAEHLLFQLSYIDSAFDRLLPFRNKVIENTIEAVQSHPKLDDSTPPSLKILIIRTCLLRFLNHHPIITSNNDNQYVEDSFILRVYAGEAIGSKIVFESIVQKIAKYFDVETTLTESFMIVKDHTFHDGYGYVLMTPKKAKVFSHRHIISTLALRQPDLDKLLIPLKNKHILNEIIGTEIQTGLSESEIGVNNIYNDIYKHSHSHIKKSHIQCFGYLLHSILANPQFAGAQISSTIADSGFSEKLFIVRLTTELPFNIVHFQNKEYENQIETIDFKTVAQNFFEFNHLNIYYEDSKTIPSSQSPLKFKIGEVVLHTRSRQIGVIIGHKTSEFDQFYTFYNQYGEPRICDKDTLLKHENITELDLHILTTERWIGVLFSHFDYKENRFIPTQHLLKLFPDL